MPTAEEIQRQLEQDPAFQKLSSGDPEKALQLATEALRLASDPTVLSPQGQTDQVIRTEQPRPREFRRQTGLSDIPLQAAAGFNQGLLVDVLGAPQELIGAALRAVGVPIPEESSQQIANFFNQGVPDPQNRIERISRGTGEVVGQAAIPLGASIKAGQIIGAGVQAGRTTEVLPQVNSVFNAVRTSLLELSKIHPGKLSFFELGIASSAGFTGATLKEAFPDSPNAAEFVGQLVGSFGATATVALIKKASSLARRRLAGLSEAEIEQEIGEQLNQQVTSTRGTADKIDDALEQAESTPGLQPTLGNVEGERALSLSEQALQRTSPGIRARFEQRAKENAEAIESQIESLEPGSRQDLDIFRARLLEKRNKSLQEAGDLEIEAQRRVDVAGADVTNRTREILNSMDSRLQAADARLQNRLESLSGSLSDKQLGQVIRQEFDKELALFRAESEGIYNQIPDSVPIDPVSTRAVATRLKGKLTGVERQQDVASEIGVALDEFTSSPGDISFEKLRAFRKRLLAESKDLTLSGQSDQRLSQVSQLLEAVDADIRQLGSIEPINETQRQAKEVFLRANEFFAKGAARLKQGAAGRLRLKQFDRFKVADQEIPALFVKGEVSMEDFNKAFEGRESARQALSDWMQLDFFKSAVSEGRVNIARANAWLSNKGRQAALNAFPELKKDLGNIVGQQSLVDDLVKQSREIDKSPEAFGLSRSTREFRQLDEAQRHADSVRDLTKRTRIDIEKDAANLFLNEDVDGAVKKILNDPNPVQTSKAIMDKLGNDPESLRGFQRSVLDHMMDRVIPKAIDAIDRPQKQARVMKEFIEKNLPVLESVFGQQRVANLKVAQRNLELLGRAGSPSNSPPVTNIASGIADWGPFLSRLYAGPLGRNLVGWKFLVSSQAMRNITRRFAVLEEEKVRTLLTEAFLDPKVAQTLMLAAQGANTRLVTKRMRAHLVSLGFEEEGNGESRF